MGVTLPSFDELPNKYRYWKWGPPGSEAEGKGMLNILTSDVVQAASKEIQTGERVAIGWKFNKPDYPPLHRVEFKLDIKYINDPIAFDDEISINPQSTSQWDGFRHYSQRIRSGDDDLLATAEKEASLSEREKRVFYGGTKHSEILDSSSDRISIHHWAKQGIVSRGVLIDYKSWADKKGIEYSCFSVHQVRLSDILEIAKESNIEFRQGDILFIRIGLIPEWEAMSAEKQKAYGDNGPYHHCGVEQNEAVARFLWDNHFAAVASDSIGWEVYPTQNPGFHLHEFLLAGWGVPIGELFDLEGLSELCKKHNRWSFFFSSVPFNVVGGVSSAPNGLAIF
ncbi:unnamed protein product [Kuraishia capsulata CBS 1993]|uniref:Cyclase n=1 Tax=Kuraishia capsulata CBS 1993 TaxID=1382522 RepID=W6MTG3_9ASCO|nr:uncharacterized protein KUCA_T00001007001 [Kuraishia capsulata CBS 1993]CDK25040.1 unnamed protein product [Kuraishia capsulata CBS 1993]